MRRLTPQPLTAEAFAPFGEVIEAGPAAEQRDINYGATTRFHDLARVDVNADSGEPLISIFRSSPVERPVRVKIMERHPIASQAFMPLSDRPYLVVVAPPGDLDPDAIAAFIAAPGQGVNYKRGTWHHYSLALDAVSDFLVVDRGGPGDNLDEVELAEDQQWTVDV
jgi:ureidoglycolate lyase